MPEFCCDLAAPTVELKHFWEECVGSGHAPLALRSDYQTQLKRCREELGFRRVRFHGWLMEEMGAIWKSDKGFEYSFLNTDRVVGFLESIGMCPFVELSFMPRCLASGRKTVFHYRANVTPPRDDGRWVELVRRLLSHWAGRWGARALRDWYFEVWNEPNLKGFWTEDRARYLKFYERTSRAVKEVDPSFRVGGPATAQNGWIPEFLEFCERRQAPVDFVSTHHYPNDPPFDRSAVDTAGQLSATPRSLLRRQTQDAHRRARGRPLFYTEWSSSSDARDQLHDQSYCAAFIIKTVMEANGLVDGYSYWVFSDLFTEQPFPATPFHGGFGLMNLHGIPKPSYRAFQLLHGVGSELCRVDGCDPTVDVWVVRRGQDLVVLLTNFALPRHRIGRERVKVTLLNTRRPAGASAERIDEEHANARTLWEEMGRPEYLSDSQIAQLDEASRLQHEKIPVRFQDGATMFNVELPPQSVAAITVDFAPAKGERLRNRHSD